MKPISLLVAATLLLMTGCGPTPDEISLQPYKDIPTGTVVTVGMKIKTNLGYDLVSSNEYVLEGFEDGFVTLRGTNGISLGYAGSMIKFIEMKK
jgi:hypothetical protein